MSIHEAIIRGPCVHAPVWVQMKMLFQKGCFEAVVGGSPVPCEVISKRPPVSHDLFLYFP
jgi:hypothetical protein